MPARLPRLEPFRSSSRRWPSRSPLVSPPRCRSPPSASARARPAAARSLDRRAFVSDIFHEVDEEVRREQLKKLWDRWGNYIVVLAFLVVLGIAGSRGWEWWEAKKSQEAGAAFEAALLLAQAGKHDEAGAAFAKVAADSPAGYRILARF